MFSRKNLRYDNKMFIFRGMKTPDSQHTKSTVRLIKKAEREKAERAKLIENMRRVMDALTTPASPVSEAYFPDLNGDFSYTNGPKSSDKDKDSLVRKMQALLKGIPEQIIAEPEPAPVRKIPSALQLYMKDVLDALPSREEEETPPFHFDYETRLQELLVVPPPRPGEESVPELSPEEVVEKMRIVLRNSSQGNSEKNNLSDPHP